jgi:hypothetical protein
LGSRGARRPVSDASELFGERDELSSVAAEVRRNATAELRGRLGKPSRVPTPAQRSLDLEPHARGAIAVVARSDVAPTTVANNSK